MDKISPIKERILFFLEKMNITKLDFCNNTSISYANMKGKGLASEIGGDKLAKILSFYTNINSEWLIIGKGSMLKDQPDAFTHTSEPHVQYGSQNDEIKNLREQVKEYKRELENKQKIIDSQLKTIDEQNEQIKAYRTGRIVNTEGADVRAPKRGTG
jgi:peptidoglycan hydrolase CwlO-like protein